MSREACPNENDQCKYAPDCYSDNHHIYGRPKSGIAKKFGSLIQNQLQLCRVEHEELHALDGVIPLPDIDTMKRAINGQHGS